MRKEKGITLVALVITIIILVILVGVTVNAMFNKGIIDNSKTATSNYEKESIKEQIKLDIAGKKLRNDGTISDDTLKTILKKYGTINYEEDETTIKSITTTKGGYEISIEEIFRGTTQDKEPTFTTVANVPDTTGFNKSNTYYVSWDLTNSPYQINENTNLNGIAPDNWYDYTAGVNKWANVKTTGGENDCYWVWIPRYAYKVPTKSSTAETIEVKFLDKATNIPIGETEAITNTTPTPGTWVVHPAFTSAGNGGFGELTGIWVAKFEASSSNVSVATVENDLATTGGGDTNSLQVRVIPNVTSWRGITVNNIFTVCRNLTVAGNSLENTNNIDSHMMKNTEWGACAYLSRSVYGKNGKVWNNPYYSTTDYSPITGLCGNKPEYKTTTYNDTNTYKYNTTEGRNASTSGNVYGIYDMAGGAVEYVAAIYTGGASDDNRSKLWDSNNSKYVDKYTNTIGSQSTYYGNTDKYGDAVYETSASGNSALDNWESSYCSFPTSSKPVFTRGGQSDVGHRAGTFAFGSFSGETETHDGFRPVVLSSQP